MKRYLIGSIILILLIVGVLYFSSTQNKHREQSQKQKVAEQQKSFGSDVTATPAQTNIQSFLGSISHMTEDGFVVKNVDGSTATFTLSEKTEYIGGEKADLAVGKDVSGYGIKNKEGEIIAEKIQVNPKPFMKKN